MGKYIQFVCSGVSNEHRYFVAEIFKYYSGNIPECFPKFGSKLRKFAVK